MNLCHLSPVTTSCLNPSTKTPTKALSWSFEAQFLENQDLTLSCPLICLAPMGFQSFCKKKNHPPAKHVRYIPPGKDRWRSPLPLVLVYHYAHYEFTTLLGSGNHSPSISFHYGVSSWGHFREVLHLLVVPVE